MPRTYFKHGLTTLKRAVNGLGNRVIDKRTATGKALAKWRADLIGDLGGDDAISTQSYVDVDDCFDRANEIGCGQWGDLLPIAMQQDNTGERVSKKGGEFRWSC